jgi:putative nucleotidyltransferase with HDIG domain
MPTLIPAAQGCPEQNESLETIIASLLRLLQLKNQKLFLHSKQVANYAVSIAAQMRLPKEEIERIRMAAVLHDIGQLSVPNSIIAKLPYLSAREMSLYRGHCNAGAAMLENMEAFTDFIPYIRSHHEQWDGKGYPKRLKGVNIPLGARIIAVANYYDRFINPCEQNWVKTKKEAVKELNNIAGTVLDPEVVKAFITALG